MRVFYEDKFYTIKFPDDTKYFKLFRKYNPNFHLKIGSEMIKIKYVKAVGEVRSGKKNKHHNKASSVGGQSIESNLISMDISRHNAFHLIFKNLSFVEAAELLLRTDKMKKKQR